MCVFKWVSIFIDTSDVLWVDWTPTYLPQVPLGGWVPQEELLLTVIEILLVNKTQSRIFLLPMVSIQNNSKMDPKKNKQGFES